MQPPVRFTMQFPQYETKGWKVEYYITWLYDHNFPYSFKFHTWQTVCEVC